MKNEADDYPRPPLRRRLLVLLLAVVMATVIVLALIYRPGDPKRGVPRAARDAPAAPASAVGGKTEVMLLPAPGAASAPR